MINVRQWHQALVLRQALCGFCKNQSLGLNGLVLASGPGCTLAVPVGPQLFGRCFAGLG